MMRSIKYAPTKRFSVVIDETENHPPQSTLFVLQNRRGATAAELMNALVNSSSAGRIPGKVSNRISKCPTVRRAQCFSNGWVYS